MTACRASSVRAVLASVMEYDRQGLEISNRLVISRMLFFNEDFEAFETDGDEQCTAKLPDDDCGSIDLVKKDRHRDMLSQFSTAALIVFCSHDARWLGYPGK